MYAVYGGWCTRVVSKTRFGCVRGFVLDKVQMWSRAHKHYGGCHSIRCLLVAPSIKCICKGNRDRSCPRGGPISGSSTRLEAVVGDRGEMTTGGPSFRQSSPHSNPSSNITRTLADGHFMCKAKCHPDASPPIYGEYLLCQYSLPFAVSFPLSIPVSYLYWSGFSLFRRTTSQGTLRWLRVLIIPSP